jgi:hypothetical protein
MSDATPSKILSVMLERLFAGIANGPSLNCRPHSSRQRVDVASLAGLRDIAPSTALRSLLSPDASTKILAKVPMPKGGAQVKWGRGAAADAARADGSDGDATVGVGVPPGNTAETAEARAERAAFNAQQQLITKLRVIIDEARTYEEDTGVHVLNIGFPLLSLPATGMGKRFGGRRILAPLAFIPVALRVQGGTSPSIEIECQSDEVDRVVPNEALLSWLEQQTGKAFESAFSDEEGTNPWREIAEIVRHAAKVLEIAVPAEFAGEQMPESFALVDAPKAEDAGEKAQVFVAAVLGLFPASKQGLIRDTKEMVAEPKGATGRGPIQRFVTSAKALEAIATEQAQASSAAVPAGALMNAPTARAPAPEATGPNPAFLIANADPCQAHAVTRARSHDALVIHGPPGTGKSQTITNIIGDHLARGERVLFVCDKRTALDVVANRLNASGLSELCALVHDPQRDQKNLYMSIREQLDGLGDKTLKNADRTIEKFDAEIKQIHADLSAFRALLSDDREGSHSLHELVGEMLALMVHVDKGGPVPVAPLRGVSLAKIEAAELDIVEALKRGESVGYATNPWVPAAAVPLATYLSTSGESVRQRIDALVTAAMHADETRHESIIPFSMATSLAEQAQARATLRAQWDVVMQASHADARSFWSPKAKDDVARAAKSLAEIAALVEQGKRETLDAELSLTLRSRMMGMAELASSMGALEAFIASNRSFLHFLAFGKKKAAQQVLQPLGLALTPENAQRASKFLAGVRTLMVIRATLESLKGATAAVTTTQASFPDAQATLADATATRDVLDVLSRLHNEPSLAPCTTKGLAVLRTGEDASEWQQGLEASSARAKALEAIESQIDASAAANDWWFAGAWRAEQKKAWREGGVARPTADALRDRLPTLESVLRLKDSLAKLDFSLGAQAAARVRELLAAGASPELGLDAMRLSVTTARAQEILEATPGLHAFDAERVHGMFARWESLAEKRREASGEKVLSHWRSLQRARLMAATGSRLNSEGAKVRQRLLTRGSKALRLRQVLQLGSSIEGGDPILDLRPVWMASPETVAQCFPRTAIFDVIVFDEASQCRLEDALPVLTRAKRVVIAGDPKQLPPTRFFESGAAASDDDTIETDEQLFEAQQTSVEDLLSAALNLDIEESYLDVHYRSRNSDLIEFSNEHFYSKRLQAIPGHPRNRTVAPPLSLRRVEGVYEDRTNQREADEVVRIVKDLLKRADPPSIGIACFNLAQRDLIVETLDIAAEEDATFAAKLAAARSRREKGSNEGLFVKNLENVQGDERDHIIISTTYGPDKHGKFYRRFGPLLQPGGGRRLNVLVTRARQEIHLVTSIPRQECLALPEVPQGVTPTGGWLLLAYLKYAEEVGAQYVADLPEEVETQASIAATEAIVQASSAPSPVATGLAGVLEHDHATGSIVHWGNDGFCVDVALRHPTKVHDVTCGLLCDFARYAPGQDPIEWDLFRTGILEAQGWRLERIWSPAIIRDLPGTMQRILAAATAEAART